MSLVDEFAGGRFLITGAASGIGRALSSALSQAEAELILVDRNQDGRDIADAAGAAFLQADLARPEEVLSEITAAATRLDGLIHVAGVPDHEGFPEVSQAEWDLVHAVNLRAPFLLTQALAGSFPPAGGSVVNVASVAGSRVVSTTGRLSHAYSSAKAGLLHLTRTLAVELAPRRIRVNSVSPGFVRTPIVEDVEAIDGLVRELTPLGRWGEPSDMVDAVLFLLSPRSSFVTGTDLVVDGGLSASGMGAR